MASLKGRSSPLVERGETHAIEVAALRRWRIKVPGDLAFEFEDRLYVAVADLGGVRTNIEQRTQRLLVNVSPSLLEHADIQFPAAVTDTKLSTAPLAGFLNYTLFGYTSSDTSYASGFFELGVSGDLGSLINTAAVNTRRRWRRPRRIASSALIRPGVATIVTACAP